jgi:hypothetical protein
MGGAVLVLLGYVVGTLRTVCRTARTTTQNDPRKAATTWGEGTQGTTATGTGPGPGSAGRSACCTGGPATSRAIESLRCPSGHPLSRPTAARPAGVCARSVRRALRRAPPQRCVHPPRLAGDARHASSSPTPRALAGRCLGDRRRRGHRRRPSASAPSLGERAGQAAAQRIGDGWRCRAPRAGAGSIRKPCCGQVCPTGGAA